MQRTTHFKRKNLIVLLLAVLVVLGAAAFAIVKLFALPEKELSGATFLHCAREMTYEQDC